MNVPNHADVVASVKSQLVARGVSLVDACGAFAITKRVAWQLRAEGAGLLDKPSGNNCQGYAADIVMYPDGTAIDTLIDAGGTNGPTWDVIDPIDPARYRPAIDPGDVVVQPPAPTPDPPPPAPTPVPFPADRLDELLQSVALVVGALSTLLVAVNALTAKVNELEQKGIAAHLRF